MHFRNRSLWNSGLVNWDVVYESTKSQKNFLGPKINTSVKNHTISERNEF